mgnify:CR=1 FL=1
MSRFDVSGMVRQDSVDAWNLSMFVCGGAFAGLEKVIRDRSAKGGIGFSAEVMSKDNMKSVGETLNDVEPEDLIGFGLIPELVGRLPVLTHVNSMTKDALVRILSKSYSPCANTSVDQSTLHHTNSCYDYRY